MTEVIFLMDKRPHPQRKYEMIDGQRVGYQGKVILGDGSHHLGAITCVCDEFCMAHHHVDGAIIQAPLYVRRFLA